MKFIATADHSRGESISHPCTVGLHSDPTDCWQVEIDATSLEEAEDKAQAALDAEVDADEPCGCERRKQSGSSAWWESVTITLWPRDGAAMLAVVNDGGEPWTWQNCQDFMPASLVLAAKIIGEVDSPTAQDLARAVLAGTGCGFALHDALIEAGETELAEQVG